MGPSDISLRQEMTTRTTMMNLPMERGREKERVSITMERILVRKEPSKARAQVAKWLANTGVKRLASSREKPRAKPRAKLRDINRFRLNMQKESKACSQEKAFKRELPKLTQKARKVAPQLPL